MDIPRLSKPSFTKLTGSKLTGWHFTILSAIAIVVLGVIFLQTTGSDMEFPKLTHKTSYRYTGNDGADIRRTSREVFIGQPIADGVDAATKWMTTVREPSFSTPSVMASRTQILLDQECPSLDTVAGPHNRRDPLGLARGWSHQ